MEPEQLPQPEQPVEVASSNIETYQDDMAKAMDVTNPAQVQVMIDEAREEEAEANAITKERRERTWYSLSSLLFFLLTLGIIGYGAYYYTHLTVPVQPAPSVGVFDHTDNIVVSTTTIQQVLTKFENDPTLPEGKPILVNLVTDAQSNALITNSQLYSFINATNIPQPLQAAIANVRLGVINTGKAVVPFIIASTTDPEKTSNELGNAEPTLLQQFYQALDINLATYQNAGTAFQSQFFYNIPVRSLMTASTAANNVSTMVFLYGYVSSNIVVIAPNQDVLKAVYDTLITQR